jgi:autotransporter passenger strand-loop-strand repeat protein
MMKLAMPIRPSPSTGTTVASGGVEVVSSGGTANGTVLGGGTEVVTAGGIAGGTVTFTTNGDLIVDQSTTSMTFGASVSGLANTSQTIDLADMSFNNVGLTYSGGTTSGTLTVTNGTETTNINLIGDYTIGNFKSASDGNGGTLIYDPHQRLRVKSGPGQ